MKLLELPLTMRKAAMRLADEDIRKQHEMGIFGEGDPNHAMYNDGLNYTRCVGLSYGQIIKMQSRK